MAATGLSVRAWTSNGLVLARGRRWAPYAIALGLALVVGLAVIGLHCAPCGKIDANRILSPWDRSAAPPAYVKRAEVRILKMKRDQPISANASRAALNASARGTPSGGTASTVIGRP